MPRLIEIKAYRVTIAYWTALRVVTGYLWLDRMRRWRGEGYYQKRIQNYHTRSARRIYKAILRLNGLFIKLGQMLSSMAHILPDQYLEVLEDVQDKAPETSPVAIRKMIVNAFGAEPESLFDHFDSKPVASASIAQVHQAKLADGRRVAVKVKHPHIDRIARIDVAIISRLSRMGMRMFKIEGMEHVPAQIGKMVDSELNFRAESESMRIIRSNLRKRRDLVIPKVHEDLSNGSVLTTDWYEGVKVNNVEKLDSMGIDRKRVAKSLIELYCDMVLRDGVYHADPHPGNFLVLPDGKLVMLDFGAVGVVNPDLRNGIPEIIEAALKNDTERIIEVSRRIGFLSDNPDADEIARKMITALREFMVEDLKVKNLNFRDVDLDPLNNRMIAFLKDVGVRGITKTIRVPEDWVLLNRMTSLLAGLVSKLAPEMNPLDVVRPWLRRRLLRQPGKLVEIGIALVQNRAKELAQTARQLREPLKEVGMTAAGVLLGKVIWAGELASKYLTYMMLRVEDE